MSMTTTVLMGDDHKPEPDESVFAWNDAGSHTIKLGITNPQGCWGRAGLHTGDIIITMDDSTINNANQFYSGLDKLKPGDHMKIEVQRRNKLFRTTVIVTSQQVTLVKLEKLSKLSAKQQMLYNEWITGT